MDSTVRSRPNHYETLGLKPTATSAEIEQAFTRELRRPRPFGGVAHLSIAYETLRDPAKRRAYDTSLGLGAQPERLNSLAARWNEVQFIGSALTDRAKRPISDLPPRPVRQISPHAPPKLPAEPRLPSFLAASLREPAKPEPRHDPPVRRPQAEQPRPQAEAKPRLAPPISGDRLLRGVEDRQPRDVENVVIPWKRTAIGVVGLVAAIGLFGAWTGWEAGNDIEAQLPERAVKVALPPAKARETSVAVAAAPAPRVEQEARLAQEPLAVASAPIEPEPAAQPPATAAVQQPTEFARAAQSPGLDTAIEAFAAEAPAPAPVAASLGLPNRVVARTIERIGYSCGEVASTTAVENSPGVFKVTCTSGSSYQARPVGGRYRFRRWDRQ